MKHHLSRFWTLVLIAISLLAIGTAGLFTAGRIVVRDIDSHRVQLDRWLSDKLGVRITTSQLSGRWNGLAPVLEVDGLLVQTADRERILLGAGGMLLEPDLLRTLIAREPVWKRLELENVGLYLQETAEGHWEVPGFSSPGGADSRADALWQMLVRSREIRMESVRVLLAGYSGIEFDVVVEQAEIDNIPEFHRFAFDAYLNAPENRVGLVLEVSGEPQSMDELTGIGHLDFHAENLDRSVAALLRRYLVTDLDLEERTRASVSASIWLELSAGRQLQFAGTAEMHRIPLNWFSEQLREADFSARIAGQYNYPDDLRVDFRDARAVWDETGFPALDFSLTKGFGERWRDASIWLAELPVRETQRALRDAGALPGRVAEVLADLDPAGTLRNLHVQLTLGQQPLGYRLRADVVDVAVDSHRSSPVATGIDGYLEIDEAGGFLELDGGPLQIAYPKVYSEPLQHEAVRGRIDWRIDSANARYAVFSGPLQIEDAAGNLRGQFRYEGPLADDGFGSELTLDLGIEGTSAEWWDRLTPEVVRGETRRWLESSIRGGTIAGAAVIYRGSVRADRSANRTVQVRLSVADGDLEFSPQWPVATGIEGEILVDNGAVRARVERGSILGNLVETAQINVVPGDDGIRRIAIEGTASGSGDALLRWFSESPLRERVGDALGDWRAEGEYQGAIALRFPLAGVESAEDLQADIEFEIDLSSLELTAQRLQFTDLTGQIGYAGSGLWSRELSGSLWGQAVAARIEQDSRLGPVKIYAEGYQTVSAIADWLGAQEQGLATGGAEVAAEITLPAAGAAPDSEIGIEFRSDLQGVGIELPYPLHKAPDQADAARVVIRPGASGRRTSIQIGAFDANLQFNSAGALRAASFAFQSTGLPELQEGQVQGQIISDRIDLDEQLEFWTTRGFAGAGDALPNLLGLQPLVRVQAASTRYREGEYGRIDLLLSAQGPDWKLEFTNPTASGNLLLDATRVQPPRLAFTQLVLPRREPAEEGAVPPPSALLEVDPRKLPELDVSIARLRSGDLELGDWRFHMQGGEAGLQVSGIVGGLAETRVQLDDELNNLIWSFDGIDHVTVVNVSASTGNLARLFEQLGMIAPLRTDSGEIYLNFVWNAPPDGYRGNNPSGIVGLQLGEGEFYQPVEGAGGALLRLVSLFNITTWARRLQFDFADVTASGTAFDSLTGDLLIRGSQVSTLSPLQIALSSGRMQFDGDFDLGANSVDARIVATLPVRQNLTWVAALLGGLPVAAGVWVAGQIFGDQLDNLASVSYRVSGDLDDPSIRVERVFDSSID